MKDIKREVQSYIDLIDEINKMPALIRYGRMQEVEEHYKTMLGTFKPSEIGEEFNRAYRTL